MAGQQGKTEPPRFQRTGWRPRSKRLVYYFRVYEEGYGYWAECIELPGCKTEGDSIGDLTQNAEEALNLYLEEPEDSSLSFPVPVQPDATINLSSLL